MNLMVNALLNGYSIIVLIIILVYTVNRTKDQTLEYKLFKALLISTMILLLFDIFGRFDGLEPGYYFINSLGNFVIFSCHLVLPSLWLLYVYYQLNHDKKKLIKPIIVLAAFNLANFIIMLFNCNTGWYYYIDEAVNIYHRGPLHALPATVTLVLLLLTAVYVLFMKKHFDKKIYTPLLFFAIPPFLGMIAQIYFYNIDFVLIGASISLIVVFLGIQNKIIYTDYLTDTGNRTKLEYVLEEKVLAAKHKKTFSLVMADINEFKQINDTYGHAMGDEALKSAASLLKECVRSRDYIFRFGGDEFCLILDISDNYMLERLIMRIGRHFESFNQKSELPFELSLSMGYAVYKSKSNMAAEEFLRYVDLLMYKEKQSK